MTLRLSYFDFDLPDSFIAQTPLEDRTASKLFVLHRESGVFKHKTVADLPNILTENDVLVFNKSRVIPARITGDFGEIFLSRKEQRSLFPAKEIWNCLVRPGRKFKEGRIIELPGDVRAEVLKVNEDGTRDIQFSQNISSPCQGEVLAEGEGWGSLPLSPADSGTAPLSKGSTGTDWFQSWLQEHGTIPQPPYVKDQIENPDRYQTTFSGSEGSSVAAPTAGLHFTSELLEELKAKGIETHFVHLDVGLGTFLPVKTENVLEHKMHAESFFLTEETAEALNKAKREGKRIIAVGTTSIRVLESCAAPSPLISLPEGEGNYDLQAQAGETDIFIYPGYKFKFVDVMFTNFHTPKSTLLMLVSAFVQQRCRDAINRVSTDSGRDLILKAYEEAKQQGYRFYSFGDAMLIL